MSNLSFHPMIGNLIAILQLAGTGLLGCGILKFLKIELQWLLALASGMVVVSQFGYLLILFNAELWMLEVIAWIILFAGIFVVILFSKKLFKSVRFILPLFWVEYLFVLLSGAFILLAFGPPSQADALDYHWGVPVYILRHGYWPSTNIWLHGSLAGIGEVYILLGLLLQAENISTILQAVGIIGFAYFISSNQSSRHKRNFIKLFILASPVILFFVSGPKPQLFAQVITALALWLSFREEELSPKHYILIVLLLCGAAQQKLSFVLTGGVIGLWATYKILYRYPFVALQASLLVLIFFAPKAWWNWQQVSDPDLFTLLTPLPDAFIQGLKDYREQKWWFPFNLVAPDSLGSISATIGLQVTLITFLRFKDGPWRHLLSLIFLAALLTYFFGQPTARSFYEFILWIAVCLSLSNFWLVGELFMTKVIAIQGILVLILAGIGLYFILPGAFSLKLREQVMLKITNNYAAIKWANEIIPKGALVATKLRSASLIQHDFIPLDWERYYNKSKAKNIFLRATHLLTTERVRENTNKIHEITVLQARRNPMNKNIKYKVYIHKLDKK